MVSLEDRGWKFEPGGVRGVSNRLRVTLDWQLMVLPLPCGEKKMLKNKKGKKLCYKGLILVILGIESLEVEPVAWLLQELTV